MDFSALISDTFFLQGLPSYAIKWKSVGLVLRVLPLIPQIVFLYRAVDDGDTECLGLSGSLIIMEPDAVHAHTGFFVLSRAREMPFGKVPLPA
jgi:hypothetical protein